MPSLDPTDHHLLYEPNDVGWTPIHLAAEYKLLDRIPAELITPEVIDLRTRDGQSVMQLAATKGQLKYLPSELLTRERLCSSFGNVGGFYFRDTPLHAAAALGELDVIPWNLIEPSDLELENQSGLSVLSLAALMENFKQMPRHFLTPEAILREDRAGMNVLLGCAACGVWDGGSDLHPRPEGLEFLTLCQGEKRWHELENRLNQGGKVGEMDLIPWDEISPDDLLNTISECTVVSYAIQSRQTDRLPTKLLTRRVMESPGCPDESFRCEPHETSLSEAVADGYVSALRIPIPYLLEKIPHRVDLELLEHRRDEIIQVARAGDKSILRLQHEKKPLYEHLNIDPCRGGTSS